MAAIAARAATRVRRRPRALDLEKVLGAVLSRTLMFGVIAVATYFTVGIAGQVMTEQSRKEASRLERRAKEATLAADVLRSRVAMLTDDERMEDWALARGFVRPLPTPAAPESERGGTLVARADR